MKECEEEAGIPRAISSTYVFHLQVKLSIYFLVFNIAVGHHIEIDVLCVCVLSVCLCLCVVSS